MQPFTLKDKSWHLWVANCGTERIYPKYGTDICEYTHAFLKGLMLLFFISAVCVALAVWTGFSILNTVMFALYGQELLFPTMVFWGVVSFFGIVICAALYADYRHKNQKPPGFTTLVYRKIKHKMCFEINFK